MIDLDKEYAIYISKLWRKTVRDSEQEMPSVFKQYSTCVLHLQGQSPSLVVRRAWSRGERFIYLYVYEDDAELLSRRKANKKTPVIEIDILPLIEMDK